MLGVTQVVGDRVQSQVHSSPQVPVLSAGEPMRTAGWEGQGLCTQNLLQQEVGAIFLLYREGIRRALWEAVGRGGWRQAGR